MLRFAWVGAVLLACGSAAPADEKSDLEKLAKDIKSKDAAVRLKAIRAAGERGPKAKSLARELCDATLDRSAECSAAAILALETVRPDLYKPVVKMVVDLDDAVNAQGVKQLAELGEAGHPALGIVHNQIKTRLTQVPDLGSEKLPGAAYVALKRMKATDTGTITFLKTLSTSDGLSTFTGAVGIRESPAANYHRQVAIEMLADWAGRDEEKRKTLVPIIRAGFDNDVTILDAIRLAGAYGKVAKDLIPALKRLKVSPKADVREAASRAIEAIEEQTKK